MGISDGSGLWFGLTLPAIVLMYLFKRKYIDTVVPSHLLWNRVLRNIEANRPWQKLQNRLLLWLQLFVAALLVFALMKPFVWTSGSASYSHTVIIVDTSASMSAVWDDAKAKAKERAASRLDQVKEQLKANLDAAGPEAEFTLVKLGSEPDVLLSREKNRSLLKEAVDKLAPDYGKAAYRETLSLAEALTRNDPEAGVIVYTDGRFTESMDPISFGDVPVHIVSIGDGPETNASIEQFGVKPGESPDKAAGIASVRNYRNTSATVHLDLYGDGKLLDSRKISIEGGKSIQVPFEGLAKADVYRLRLSPEDGYAPDNEAFAFLDNGDEPAILLFSPGNLFLEKALQLSGARVTRMNPTSEGKKESKPPALPEDKPDLIVIDGAPPSYLKGEPWAKLIHETPLLTWGGQGEKVPLTSGEVKTASHPVMRYLSFATPMAGELLDTEPPPWGNPILNIGGQPAAYAGTEAGQKRLTFLFALEDSDLPLRPEFPILVGNAVNWLESGRTAGLGRVIAGTAIDIPVQTEASEAFWIPVDGYALRSGADKIAAEKNARSVSSRQTSPGIPGLWRFETKGADGGSLSSYSLEVAADPAESGVPDGIKTFPVGGSVKENVGHSGNQAASTDGHPAESSEKGKSSPISSLQSQHSLVSVAVLLVLLVILAEWGVYQRGHSI